MHQMSLQFDNSPSDKSAELELLLSYLLGRTTWTTASVIAVDLGMSDRKIRDLASSSDQVASAPGTPGYKHLRNCTPDEISAAVAKLKSQGRKMWKRGQRLHSNFHKAVHNHD